MMRPLLRRLRRDDRGVALVEFAMVLPILLLIFAVIVEGGRLMWSYQSVTAGVRDATRYIARVTPSDICATGGSLDATAVADAKDLVVGAGVAGEVTLTADDVAIDLDDCPDEAGPFRVAQVATVTVAAEVEIRFPFAGIFTLVGGRLDTITTTVTDHTRVFGS